MIYYINVTSWNLLESFVTESISPHSFYSERSFGNNLSRYLDSTHELGNFLILSTRKTKSDYSILVDSSLIDDTALVPVPNYSTLYTYSKTIYYQKGLVSFSFANKDLISSLIAESQILLDVKCVEKYQDCFVVSEKGHKGIVISTKLANGFSFDKNVYVEKDNKFNILKGAVLSYARGILTTSNNHERFLKSQLISLKNIFAGLNTTIMISGNKVANEDEVMQKLSDLSECYKKLRNTETNQFEILRQQFHEAVNLSYERSKIIAQSKSPNSLDIKNCLEQEKIQIENEIFKFERINNILSIREELQSLKDQERMNGLKKGQKRSYFKKGTREYERKSYLKQQIEIFEKSNSEYHSLLEKVRIIDQKIFEVTSGTTQYDNVILGVFTRISDIMNDLIKKVNDTEKLNNIDLSNIEISSNGDICLKLSGVSQAETEYFNTLLSYIVSIGGSEQLSDSLIQKIIVETAKIFKTLPSSSSEEGKAILKCLREFWCYKNQYPIKFVVPEKLPVFQSIMAFFIKPFGYDQIERYLLNKNYEEKACAFMLWGACLGYAALPKTFTNIMYQDFDVYNPIDEFLIQMSEKLR